GRFRHHQCSSVEMESHRQFVRHSERVKSVDLHPSEPWLLVGLMNGEVNVWNYQTEALVKNFKVCESPVRAAVFVARKGWVITGSDDKHVRVYDYNSGECLRQFEAHNDFVRSIAVHPTKPIILTAGDDKLIKQWNWENEWALEQTYEGHGHYVMQVVLNPKDGDSFASASMDNTIKLWHIGSATAVGTLVGHEKGVNCVDFCHGSDKSYLVSGADDHLVKIWDYKTKKCVHTLEGHTMNVTSVRFHPSLPLVISAAECMGDLSGTVRVWNAESNRLESVLNDELERAWCTRVVGDTVAVGYDKGCVVHRITNKQVQKSSGASDKKAE
ncbi:hypothetical protein PMAYCL1PPCAC_15230, partial [Pristionchus mayeri]